MVERTLELKVSDEVSFAYMGNGFTLINSLTRLIATEYLTVSYGLWVYKVLVFKDGRRTLTLAKKKKKKLLYAFPRVRIAYLPSKVWIESALEKILTPVSKIYKIDQIRKPFPKICLPGSV